MMTVIIIILTLSFFFLVYLCVCVSHFLFGCVWASCSNNETKKILLIMKETEVGKRLWTGRRAGALGSHPTLRSYYIFDN